MPVASKQEQRNRSRFECERVALDEIENEEAEAYFCQVGFLCRLARNCFRRLCLLIFALRRFFSEPIRF